MSTKKGKAEQSRQVISTSQLLAGEIVESIDSTIKKIVEGLKSVSSIDGALAVMITAVFQTMRGFGGREEEIRFLSLLIVSRCGEKGIEVNASIRQAMGLTLTSVSTTVTAPKAVTAAIPQKAPVMKPTTQTGPARVLGNSPSAFISDLRGFLAGKPGPTFEVMRRQISIVFNGDLLAEEWQVLLSSIQLAWQKGGYLISNKDNPMDVFGKIPSDVLDSWLFGQEDQAMVSLTATVRDYKGERWFPIWARAGIVLDAVGVLVRNNPLGEHEKGLLQNLINALQEKDDIEPWLITKMEKFSVEGYHDDVENHPFAGLAHMKGSLPNVPTNGTAELVTVGR